MKHSPFGPLRALALGLAAVAAGQPEARAQFDAQVDQISIIQAINDGNAPMVAGRSTFVRVTTSLVNPPSNPVDLDGLMRVYVDGVEASFSPVFSDNGPYPAVPSPSLLNEHDTLNFVFVPPVTTDLVLEIEINPDGPNFVPEVNTANNKLATASLNSQVRNTPELVYSPIDYRPGGGGTPNVPNPVLIEPGSGDNMLQGLFPAADWFYHRTDAPSKLWTNSLSGTGSQLNNSLLMDLNMMVPVPDFIYGWVPGGLPYNGQAIGIPGKAAMGNTQTFKFQRTFAHEVGHLFGLSHTNNKIEFIGVDVEEAMAITEGLPRIKPTTLNDIMVPGLNTNQAWIRWIIFNGLFNVAVFANPAPEASGPGLLVTGIWNTHSGAVTLDHVLALPAARPTQPVELAAADFVVNAYAGGQLVQQLPIAARNTADSCGDLDENGDSAVPIDEVSVVVTLAQGAQQIERLEILPTNGAQATPVVLVRSASAPQVQFTMPSGDVSAGQITVSWAGSDPDGDELTYYLRYTRNGEHFTPLATGITATEWDVDMSQLPALVDGQGYFELFASDGLDTTPVQSPFLTGAGAIWGSVTTPPWVEIMTPDDGTSYLKGATVVLHSSGWDIEDRNLYDADIAWTSDLDGFITNGRMTSVADLSVGEHQITVTATDSSALVTTDTHVVTIVDRGLPDVGGVVNYCTPGTSASGCQATLSAVGTPSATAPSGFTLTASTVEGKKQGLFFFGTGGQQANPWGTSSSFQCVVPPTSRGPLEAAVGTSGACNGSASEDLNALWTAKPAKNPGAGAVTQAQFWYRDPANTSNQTTSLSDAVEFTVEP